MVETVAERRKRLDATYGIAHSFEAKPIFLSHLVNKRDKKSYLGGSTKRAKVLFEKLEYKTPPTVEGGQRRRTRTMKSKACLYVLQLPSCTKALKIGKVSIYPNGDGVLSRLSDYHTKYGNAKVLYIRTFLFDTGKATENQPEAVQETKLKKKLKDASYPVLRGNEYYPIFVNRLNEIGESVKTDNRPELRRIIEALDLSDGVEVY